MRFVSFFNKLTEMMERLTGHLGYLTQYAEAFISSPEVQSVCIYIYIPLPTGGGIKLRYVGSV